MAGARRALHVAEDKVAQLVQRYRDHGCSEDEIEAMPSVVQARADVEFQRYRLRREAVRRQAVGAPEKLGRRLREVLWTEAAVALLPGNGAYGWCDGGCLILSDALAELLGRRIEEQYLVEQVAIVGNGTLVGQHYLVRVNGWHFDADGASREGELLWRWEQVRVYAPRVARLDVVDVDTPRDLAASRTIARHLAEVLTVEKIKEAEER